MGGEAREGLLKGVQAEGDGAVSGGGVAPAGVGLLREAEEGEDVEDGDAEGHLGGFSLGFLSLISFLFFSQVDGCGTRIDDLMQCSMRRRR